LARSTNPPRPTDLAQALIAYGVHLSASSVFEEGERVLEEAVALGRSSGVPDSDLAEAYRALSDIHRETDQHEQALVDAEMALNLRIRANGESAVVTALARVTYGQALGTLQRYEDAEREFSRAIEEMDRSLGEDHTLTLVAVNNLGVLRQTAGDLQGAADIQRRLVDTALRTHDGPHRQVADAYQNLGTTLAKLGQLDEARGMHERAAEVYRMTVPPDSVYAALPALSIAGIDLRQQRFQAAERNSRQALSVLKTALPAGHYITAVATCRVARALVGRNVGADAESLFDEATAVLIDTDSVPDYRQECLAAAAAFYESRGRSDDAAKLTSAIGASARR
jgi:tetratricopeptide (TPR) repeat protein